MVKLIVLVLSIIMALESTEGQLVWAYDDYLKQAGNPLSDFEPHCNHAICTEPCEGAAPPPVCPANQAYCASGCACYTECATGTIICYMTKHCQELKRLFTRKKKYHNSESSPESF